MKKDDSIPKIKRRYRRLALRLAKLGPVLQGTITQRAITREDPDRPGKKKTYGPYYQWTWKKKGKTVTINLSASQAKTYQRAIDRHRELEETLDEMRLLSLAYLEKSTKGVAKRKPPINDLLQP
jgi:hypothetical protein